MTTLVFGKTGQVAQELARFSDIICVGRDEVDLSHPAACIEKIKATECDAVINAAAYTAVDKAEDDEALATLVNADAPGAMAQACAEKKLPFVHISTDYVFDGSGTRAWMPGDQTGPINAYGRSKLGGEIAVRKAGGAHAILRTSWVFSPHGNNFVKTMLRLGAERDELNIVADQIGGPTPASAIARACMDIAQKLIKDPSTSGTYHFSGDPDCSWAEFAESIFDVFQIQCRVNRISSKEFPTPAKRPFNSRMDCRSLKAAFGIDRPDWKKSLAEFG